MDSGGMIFKVTVRLPSTLRIVLVSTVSTTVAILESGTTPPPRVNTGNSARPSGSMSRARAAVQIHVDLVVGQEKLVDERAIGQCRHSVSDVASVSYRVPLLFPSRDGLRSAAATVKV